MFNSRMVRDQQEKIREQHKLVDELVAVCNANGIVLPPVIPNFLCGYAYYDYDNLWKALNDRRFSDKVNVAVRKVLKVPGA